MSKKDKLLLAVISVLTAIVIVLIAALIVVLDKDNSGVSSVSAGSSSQTDNADSTDENSDKNSGKTENSENSSDNSIVTFNPDTGNKPQIDNALPPNVEIKPQKDPVSGENKGIAFPYKIEEYNIVLEKLADYNGLYVEDGTNSQVEGVAALLVRNDGEYPIEYTEISIEYEGESLQFNISALGKGEKAIVQEKNKKAVPESTALKGNALVVRRKDMSMSADTISVTDNGDNTITVTNLTDEAIPTVRIFYKYYMQDEDLFVGGIAFSARITRLAAKAKTVISPAHYSSETGRVVMVSTYQE